jgi:hypothetical protein
VIHSPKERRAIEFFYHKAVPQYVFMPPTSQSIKSNSGSLLGTRMQHEYDDAPETDPESRLIELAGSFHFLLLIIT